jgi:HD-like signal output (HDOD) protein
MGDFIRRVRQLHSAPQVAQRLLNLTYDLQFDVNEVVDCLRSDPALAAKVLRVVNSSRYGVRGRVTSLRTAVSHLGQRSLRLLTMTFSLIDAMTRGAAGNLYQDFWRRALTMAGVASRLAALRPTEIDGESAYTAGLLSDLGVLVMAQAAGERYAAVYRHTVHGSELVAAEREAFGFAHPALAARLLEMWEFPPLMADAVRHHHEARPRSLPLDKAVAMSDLLATVLWQPEPRRLAAVRLCLERAFGVDTDGFISLVLATRQELTEQSQLFEIDLPESLDCQALMEQAREQHVSAALETALEYDSLMALFEDHTAAPRATFDEGPTRPAV